MKKIKDQNVRLYNGVEMPLIGAGFWLVPNEIAGRVTKDALSLGYRMLDTAQGYGNELGIGEMLESLNIKRENVFITSKILAEIKNYKDAKESILESLKKLRVDYIDLMLIHAPRPWDEMSECKYNYFKENLEVWKAMTECYNDGLIRAIGVSNFSVDDLKNIMDNSSIKPMVNQVCFNPHNRPLELIKFCQDNDIAFEAYSPLEHGTAKDSKKVLEIAKKYNVSFAQVCLKYVLSHGTIAIPKATSIDHLRNNLELDFDIDKEDLASLDK